jgi:hypothetical protein
MSTISASPHPTIPTIGEETLPGRLEGSRRLALMAGAGGMIVWVLMAVFAPSAMPSYLTAYTFFLGIGVGSLGFLFLHHLVGGAWGFAIRRPLEAATMTLPLMALLFLPIVVGMGSLYEWSHAEFVSHHEEPKFTGYLNVPFFLIRAVLFLGLWNGLAFLMRKGSLEQDQTESPLPTRRNQRISGPGLAGVFVSTTFAAIDWMMSIEPEWYSTIYGVMVMIGWALSAMSVAVIAASRLSNVRPLSGLVSPETFNDLGNLLLAFTMLWAYMGFSQFLLIWSGNLTEEIPWYLRRSYGGWRIICGLLMLAHFFVPFFCLLIRENKRGPTRLWWVAVGLLVMHWINDVWLIIPAYDEHRHWLSLIALLPATIGVGGLWLWVYLGHLTSRSLAPRHDPLLAQVFEHQHGGGHQHGD